jgi:hypothetical protein
MTNNVNFFKGGKLIAKGKTQEFKPQKSLNFKDQLNEPITQKKLNFEDWFTIFLLVAIMLSLVVLLFLDWI